MIDLLFRFGPDVIFVRVDGTNLSFGNTSFGAQIAPIDGLRLNQAGVIKEFPELKDNPQWREEAITRFKNRIKELPDEDQRAKYVIEDLKKYGYIPWKMKKIGFREVAIK